MVASANRINLAITSECLEAIDRCLQGRDCPFTVHIVGQVKDMVADLPIRDANIFRKPWVRMHGFVPDIAQFYADMDLVLSPVTMGTGINVKTVQAMAYGMPLLTTACGGKGIETGDAMHCHADLNGLAETLLSLTNRPEELARLAALSRTRYIDFCASGLAAMRAIFAHPKLIQSFRHCHRHL
jgi:glycosyltransferase involved in cell wall biosynthesis